MASPFPASSSKPGEGRLIASLKPDGAPTLSRMVYQYPLKLISPSVPSSHESVLVFLLSYGGGLVAGDQVDLAVEVQADARLSIVTQGHTKIFAPATGGAAATQTTTPTTRQTLRVQIAPGAALCLLPDPVQPFAGSAYEQRQTFRLMGPAASLCLLDWVTRGRTARGEDWSLMRWVGRNEIWAAVPAPNPAPGAGVGKEEARVPAHVPTKERLLVRDAVILDGDATQAMMQIPNLKDAMHGMGVLGTLILRGPLTATLGDFFLAEFAALPRLGARDFRSAEHRQREEQQDRSAHEAWRAERLELEKRGHILWSAATFRGCVVVKFGAATVEAGRNWVGGMITKEGSIPRHFGDHAIMCLN